MKNPGPPLTWVGAWVGRTKTEGFGGIRGLGVAWGLQSSADAGLCVGAVEEGVGR